MNAFPSVHIGIVTYNSAADLPACAAALQVQTYPNLSITILDNASTDQSFRIARACFPDAYHILNPRNAGFGRGHNRILSSLYLRPRDYYLALNPDVCLTPTYIERLAAALTTYRAAWGTGKLLQMDATGHATGLIYSAGHAMQRNGYAFNIGYGLPDKEFDQGRKIWGAPGAALMLSLALVAALTARDRAVFDPDMFMYGEDTDLDWRARRLGGRCWYEPRAVAYHRGSNAQSMLRDQAVVNRYLSVIKNAYPIDLLTYNLPLMIMHCAARLLITPGRGARMAGQLARLGPRAWKQRRRPTLSRAEMLAWFRWSRVQPTAQPRTLWARLRTFRR